MGEIVNLIDLRQTYRQIKSKQMMFGVPVWCDPVILENDGEIKRAWADKLFRASKILLNGYVKMIPGYFQPIEIGVRPEPWHLEHMKQAVECSRYVPGHKPPLDNPLDIYLKPEAVENEDGSITYITNVHCRRAFGGNEFICIVGGKMESMERNKLRARSLSTTTECAAIRVPYDDLCKFYKKDKRKYDISLTGAVNKSRPIAIETGVLDKAGRLIEFHPSSFIKFAKTQEEANCRFRFVQKLVPRKGEIKVRKNRAVKSLNYWYLATLDNVRVNAGDKLLLEPFDVLEKVQDALAAAQSVLEEEDENEGVEADETDQCIVIDVHAKTIGDGMCSMEHQVENPVQIPPLSRCSDVEMMEISDDGVNEPVVLEPPTNETTEADQSDLMVDSCSYDPPFPHNSVTSERHTSASEDADESFEVIRPPKLSLKKRFRIDSTSSEGSDVSVQRDPEKSIHEATTEEIESEGSNDISDSDDESLFIPIQRGPGIPTAEKVERLKDLASQVRFVVHQVREKSVLEILSGHQLRAYAFDLLTDDAFFNDKPQLACQREELNSVSGMEWLTDGFCTMYLNLIKRRNAANLEYRPLYYVPPATLELTKGALMSSLENLHFIIDQELDTVRRLETLFIFLCKHRNHYSFVNWNIPEKRLDYYDTFGSSLSATYRNRIILFANRYIEVLRAEMPELSQFRERNTRVNTVQLQHSQTNGYDCGVFALQNIEQLSRGKTPIIGQKNCFLLRGIMLAELLMDEMIERNY